MARAACILPGSSGSRHSRAAVRWILAAILWSPPLLAMAAENPPEGPAGSEHSCAVVAGAAKCWGANFSGQLGDGTNVNRSMPVPVSGLSAGVGPMAAGSEHTCAVVAGTVKCWGANFSGQLGDGTNIDRNVPVNVSGPLRGVTAIAAGSEHTCAVLAGAVKCWGTNFSGQLGDGTNIDRNAPVDITGISGSVVAIAAGSEHTCALTTGGTVWCWGANLSGQLGDGAIVARNRPVRVSGPLRGATAIAAGAEHTCALATGGEVWCWGANFSGQLGDGTNIDRSTPVGVAGLSGRVTAIATGAEHSCAVVAGRVRCWGANFSGQLGDGTDVDRNAPVGVFRLSGGVTAIAAGAEHSCAVVADGVKCWGANFSGQLGDGTNVDRNAPVGVAGLPSLRPAVSLRIY